MRAVDAVMLRLEDKKLEDAEKILFDLGRRHIEYGAKIEHIPVILFYFIYIYIYFCIIKYIFKILDFM